MESNNNQHPLSNAVTSFTTKLALKFVGPYVVLTFKFPVIVNVMCIHRVDLKSDYLSELMPYIPPEDRELDHINPLMNVENNNDNGDNSSRVSSLDPKNSHIAWESQATLLKTKSSGCSSKVL